MISVQHIKLGIPDVMHLLFNMFRVTQPSVVLLSHVTRSLYMLRTFRCHPCFMYYSTGLLSSLRNQGNVHLCVHLSKTVSSVAELHTVQVSLFSIILFFLLHLTSKKWHINEKSILKISALTVHHKYINCPSGWRVIPARAGVACVEGLGWAFTVTYLTTHCHLQATK